MPQDVASKTSKSPKTTSDATLRGLVGYNMKRAFLVIRADLTRALAPFELKMMTYSALTLIADNPGLSQSQLAEGLAIERPNLVVIIDQLENRGLVTRDRVPTDRRTYALRVTADGARLLANATRAVAEHEAELLKDLPEEERTILLRALSRIESSDAGRKR